ncbi:BatD family protein [Flavobacterium antarcticum]|uniref:BatD family protein n=1 Tax=Flavobacterium antarcticum TaxID=271155 RepID=UPI0003B61BDF|nr:BatD family protein [Flavobacterium antarcticum]
MKIKIYILLLLCTNALFAQKVTTSIDTTKNKIGAQFNLTLKAEADTATQVTFPSGKNFGVLEVIRSYKVDTIKNGGRYELIKKYGLTQFDSGKYTIPSLKVLFGKNVLFSDSLSVTVQNVAVDTLKQKMYEIKPIAKAESSSSWIWKWILGILLIIGIGALVYFLMRKFQKKKIEAVIYKSPIEKATNLLNNLEKRELWQKGAIKEYYSELTNIARNYIEEAIEIPAMESTTSELIAGLRKASLKKKMKVSPETLENLERVLMQADLVKFAKSKPLDFEIAEDKKKIEKTILTLDNAIPEAVEDEGDILNEAQRQKLIKQKLRKKKITRIVVSILVVFVVLFGTAIFFIATKGFDYLQDNLLGHPSKELVEGEWVTSEYGDSGIHIETPKVLTRIDVKKTLPKEAFAVIKDMQTFSYGSIMSNFSVSISTLQYKKETKVDLKTAVEATMQIFESQGAKNIIGDQGEFTTREGISGMKGYGTFTILNPLDKKSYEMYYETIIFAQDGGLQQINIVQKQGDKYAKEIAERVLQSVELKRDDK